MFHFATAFLDYHLKGDAERLPYLDLAPNSQDGDWKGFPEGSARGLLLEHLEPAE